MKSQGSSGMYKDHDDVLSIENIVEKIEWKNGLNDAEILGYVHGNLLFIIEKKGKRIIEYTLKSNPFRNEVFTRAINYKKLTTAPESKLADLKKYAQGVFNNYVKMFLNKNIK